MKFLKRAASSLAAAALALGSLAALQPADAAVNTSTMAPGEVTGYPAVVPVSAEQRVADWQRLQFGLFLHWGVYSEFAGHYNGQRQTIGYPEQVKAWMNIPDDAYLATAATMDMAGWDADAVCQTAKDTGMRYVMITSKHHDGFVMWDTATTDYNVVEQTAFGQDPIAQLATACAERDIELAFYFSIIDWTQHEAEPYANKNPIPESMMPMIKAQLTELLTNYGPIAELWFDMGGPTPEQSERMAGWVHDLQPATMVNSRVWNDKGDFEVGGDNVVPSDLRQGPWESILSVFPACWGYCENWPSANRSPEQLPGKIRTAVDGLVKVVAGDGQYHYNIGPKGDGSFDPFDQQVLDGIGAWMQRHPDAITGARPTYFDIPTWGRITAKDNALSLIVTNWPASGTLTVPGLANEVTSVTIDGTETALQFTRNGLDLQVTLPASSPDPVFSVVRVELDGPARMVPGQSVELSDGAGVVAADDVIMRAGAKGSGNPVHADGFVISDVDVAATTLDVSAAGIVDGTSYRVSVGDCSVVVTGAQLKAEPVIEDLALTAGEVTRARISLADPAYYADPLRLGQVVFTIGAEQPEPTETPEPPVGANLALNKPATQKGISSWGGAASLAVDGNTNPEWTGGSVSHTAEGSPQAWWQVDLGAVYELDRIEIHNRAATDECRDLAQEVQACSERLTDYWVMVSESPFSGDSLDAAKDAEGTTAWFQDTVAGNPTVIDAEATSGRYVRIQLTSESYPLTLAEVEVYGMAPTPEPTDEPTVTPEPTDEPTVTPEPTDEPTVTPEPTDGPTVTPEPTDEPTVTPDPTDEPTVTPEPTDEPTVTPEPTDEPTVSPEPTGEPTATQEPTDGPGEGTYVRQAPYTMPGLHRDLNGRDWHTECEPYSQTERCRTDIWATVVLKVDGQFVRTDGWAFNNLTYLPFMTRDAWGANPLANTGEWTAATDQRRWRTECDTARTGRDGCRSYANVTAYAATPRAEGGYTFSQSNQWVFNNIVMFR